MSPNLMSGYFRNGYPNVAKYANYSDLDKKLSRCLNFFGYFTEKISKGKRELLKLNEIGEKRFKIIPILKNGNISFKYSF